MNNEVNWTIQLYLNSFYSTPNSHMYGPQPYVYPFLMVKFLLLCTWYWRAAEVPGSEYWWLLCHDMYRAHFQKHYLNLLSFPGKCHVPQNNSSVEQSWFTNIQRMYFPQLWIVFCIIYIFLAHPYLGPTASNYFFNPSTRTNSPFAKGWTDRHSFTWETNIWRKRECW
jgi:hypothetical protein